MRPTPADNLIGAALCAAETLDLALADRRQSVPLDPRALSPFTVCGRRIRLRPRLGRRSTAAGSPGNLSELGERKSNLFVAQPPYP